MVRLSQIQCEDPAKRLDMSAKCALVLMLVKVEAMMIGREFAAAE